MKLPAWFSTRNSREARAVYEATQVTLEEFFECMMNNVPDGMTPAPEVRQSVRRSLEQIDLATARKGQEMVEARRADHENIVTMIWDVLNRRDPNAALNRIADNFDYIVKIGWGYTGVMPGLALRTFPGYLLEADLTPEQQRALIRFEDSRWDKNITIDGGTKSLIRNAELDGLAELVASRPQDVERIIDLATNRKPESIDHYIALLDSSAPEPLKDGEL